MPNVPDTRLRDLVRFYELIDRIKACCNGAKFLCNCSGRQIWPGRGIYFFQENGEYRTNTGTGSRIVRVGTHALTAQSRTTLWNRLSQHKGNQKAGGGNHRGSIFRLLVGQALIQKHGYQLPTWGHGQSAPTNIRSSEKKLEQEVSSFIGQMPLLWLAVEDVPGANSQRGYIERNAIALLSNYGKDAIDSPSKNWLGHFSDRGKVRLSGLWNQYHVDEPYDPSFIDALEKLITEAKGDKQ